MEKRRKNLPKQKKLDGELIKESMQSKAVECSGTYANTHVLQAVGQAACHFLSVWGSFFFSLQR